MRSMIMPMILQPVPLLDRFGTPLLILLLIILFVAQLRWELRERIFTPYRHAFTNALLAIPSFLILRLAIFPAVWLAAGWSEDRNFGLLWRLSLPSWMEYSLGFLLMD